MTFVRASPEEQHRRALPVLVAARKNVVLGGHRDIVDSNATEAQLASPEGGMSNDCVATHSPCTCEACALKHGDQVSPDDVVVDSLKAEIAALKSQRDRAELHQKTATEAVHALLAEQDELKDAVKYGEGVIRAIPTLQAERITSLEAENARLKERAERAEAALAEVAAECAVQLKTDQMRAALQQAVEALEELARLLPYLARAKAV